MNSEPVANCVTANAAAEVGITTGGAAESGVHSRRDRSALAEASSSRPSTCTAHTPYTSPVWPRRTCSVAPLTLSPEMVAQMDAAMPLSRSATARTTSDLGRLGMGFVHSKLSALRWVLGSE